MDLTDAVVTADAAHAQHDTAEYIGGERVADCLLFVKGNQRGLEQAIFGRTGAAGKIVPDHVSIDYSHGRIIERAIWVTDAGDIEFPHAAQVLQIRRDAYDLGGTAISKEIVHGITTLDARRGAIGGQRAKRPRLLRP